MTILLHLELCEPSGPPSMYGRSERTTPARADLDFSFLRRCVILYKVQN